MVTRRKGWCISSPNVTAKLPEFKSLPPLAPRKELLENLMAHHKMWDTDPDESLDFKILKVGGCMKLSTGKVRERAAIKAASIFTILTGKGTGSFLPVVQVEGVMCHIERTMLRKALQCKGHSLGNQS